MKVQSNAVICIVSELSVKSGIRWRLKKRDHFTRHKPIIKTNIWGPKNHWHLVASGRVFFHGTCYDFDCPLGDKESVFFLIYLNWICVEKCVHASCTHVSGCNPSSETGITAPLSAPSLFETHRGGWNGGDVRLGRFLQLSSSCRVCLVPTGRELTFG